MTTDDENEHPTLSAAQVACVAALMCEPTIEKAAARARVNERTVRRWLGRDDFRRALRAEQRVALAGVTARLQVVAAKALETLEDVMGDGEAPHTSRVTAARAVLELAHERLDIDELRARLDELEQRGAQPGGKPWVRD